MAKTAEQPEIKIIPLEKIKTNDYNPNKMSASRFNELVRNIKNSGFYDPLQVTSENDGNYTLLDGEHRFRALQVVGFTEAACVITDVADEDERKFITMRNKFLQGEIDKVKFTKMWTDMVKKYGADKVREFLYVPDSDQKMLDSLIIQVKSGLPDGMADELDKKKASGEIKNVEDLSRIVNEMFAKHGKTLSHSYMVFSFGGKGHLWIKMGKELKDKMDYIIEKCSSESKDINEVFMEFLK